MKKLILLLVILISLISCTSQETKVQSSTNYDKPLYKIYDGNGYSYYTNYYEQFNRHYVEFDGINKENNQLSRIIIGGNYTIIKNP